MAQITIPMLKDYQRPVVELYGLEALLDTGAVIPMISLPSTVVEKVFSAKKYLSISISAAKRLAMSTNCQSSK